MQKAPLFDPKALSRFHLPCCFLIVILLKWMIYTWHHIFWWLCFYCYSLTKHITKLPFQKNPVILLSCYFFFPSLWTMSLEWITSWHSLSQFLHYNPIYPDFFFPGFHSVTFSSVLLVRLRSEFFATVMFSQADVLIASINQLCR